jgi:hypothetical protein
MKNTASPGILRAWPDGVPALEFAERECADPASPLFGVPEAALMAEYPAPDTTHRVIEAVGGGNRAHANIAAEAGSRDLAALQRGAAQVPGFDPAAIALIGVSCAGFVDAVVTDLALRWLPADVVGAFD